MNSPQDIADTIKRVAKEKNIPIKKMLSDCELGINLISHLAKGQAITYLNLAKIADYLGCSVDYLLGRKEKPTVEDDGLSEDISEIARITEDFTDEELQALLDYAEFLISKRKK